MLVPVGEVGPLSFVGPQIGEVVGVTGVEESRRAAPSFGYLLFVVSGDGGGFGRA